MFMTSTGRFVPRRAYIEEAALSYPLGINMVERLRDLGILAQVLKRGARIQVPGQNATQVYEEAKNTLVVRVRKDKDFASCKPSAYYHLPLVSRCPGLCEYCYLQTTLGPRPYVRVYANHGEILSTAKSLVQRRFPRDTTFEGAATSDPVAVEYLTGSLAQTIEFFGGLDHGRFRFVTKFGDLEMNADGVPFELVTHRFSARAKKNILSVFPNTRLPLDESERKLKYGQFGYTKYLYPDEIMESIRAFFEREVQRIPGGYVRYLV
jgi:spore photoproduct lyase